MARAVAKDFREDAADRTTASVPPAAGGLKLLDRLRQAFAVRWTGFETGEEGYYADPYKTPS